MVRSTKQVAALPATGSSRPQKIPPQDRAPRGHLTAGGKELLTAGDLDMTLLPYVASPTSTRHLPCNMPPTFSKGAGQRDEAALSGICRSPAGVNQAPFPAGQCQGEGTPLRQSRATARGDRRGAGGRDGWTDGGSNRGWRQRAGMTVSRQRGLISHRGSWGLPPSPPRQRQPPLQPPQGTPPPASTPHPHLPEGGTVCNQLHPRAGGGHFSSSRYDNGPPELTRTWYPGESHGRGGRGMLSFLPHHPQPRLQRPRTCSPPG